MAGTRQKGAAALLAAIGSLGAAATAWAHPLNPAASGFLSGFAHPWTGVDHVLAMVAVGIWAAQQGGRKIWILPLLFVGGMLAGAALAWSGIALPWVEGAVATSVVVLGCLVASLARLPLALGGALVGLLAVFHGHAHGTEAGAAQAVELAAGFALATLLLHGIGIAAGLALSRGSRTRSPRGRLAFGLGGAAIAAIGLALLAGVS
jgi:urease accessory protein